MMRASAWVVWSRAVGVAAVCAVSQVGLAQVACGTPGKDGPGGVLTGVVNTYFPSPTTASLAIGATSITLGASSAGTRAVAVGDLLLVIQMQDADINANNGTRYGAGTTTRTGLTALNAAGRYEYVVATRALALGGGTVSIKGASGGGLVNRYRAAAYVAGTSGKRRFQVIRVPQYSTATFSSGLTAAAWNGTSGGVLAVEVAGVLTLGGTVSVDSMGFRGGGARTLGGGAGGSTTSSRSLSTSNFHAAKGEGIAGTGQYLVNNGALVTTGSEGLPNGSSGYGAPANAGGGANDGNPTSNDQNSGGGGGANGGAGGQGGFRWSRNLDVGGRGGSAIAYGGVATRLAMGGGGGAGTANNVTGNLPNSLSSSGATGGGLIFVRAGRVTGAGTLTANGAGANNSTDNDGSGGGGAGGGILVYVATGSLSGLSARANGGTGGTNTGGGVAHGPGGGGGGGFIALSTTGAATSVTGGAQGVTQGTVPATYGAVAGSAGVVTTGLVLGNMAGRRPRRACVARLVVSKTTSTPTVTALGAATYTVVVSNAANRADATNVQISDVLPTDFTYASVSAPVLTGGATRPITTSPVVGATVPTFTEFTIPGGGSVSLTFVATVSGVAAAGVRDNDVNVTYLSPTRSTPTGTATVAFVGTSTTAENVTVTGVPDLRVIKTHAIRFEVGVAGVYLLSPSNAGGGRSVGAITVTDTLPTGLSFSGAVGTGWVCGVSGSVVTCTRAVVIAPFRRGNVITLTVAVAGPAVPTVTNIAAIVGGGEPVGNAGNNKVTDATLVGTRVVAVTPDGAVATHLPRNGVQYTQTFTITNAGTLADSYTLVATLRLGTALSVVSVNGTAGSSGSSGVIAGAGVVVINVVYTVGAVAAGSVQTLTLTAASVARPAVNDPGRLVVTVVRPLLTISKTLYRADQTTLMTPVDKAVPGEMLYYKLLVQNTGTAAAASVALVDAVPTNMTYLSVVQDVGGDWVVGVSGAIVTATLTPTVAVGARRFVWIQVRVN